MEAAFEKVKTRHNWSEDFTLKTEQITVLDKLNAGRNVFAILPTGYGKSMLYVVPSITGMGISLVISPLRALMEDQAAMLISQHNIKAAIIKTHNGMDLDILRGTYIQNCYCKLL
jgi:superfamily II DNA helicase RecQ